MSTSQKEKGCDMLLGTPTQINCILAMNTNKLLKKIQCMDRSSTSPKKGAPPHVQQHTASLTYLEVRFE